MSRANKANIEARCRCRSEKIYDGLQKFARVPPNHYFLVGPCTCHRTLVETNPEAGGEAEMETTSLSRCLCNVVMYKG